MARAKWPRSFLGALVTPAHLALLQLRRTRRGYAVDFAARFACPAQLDRARRYLDGLPVKLAPLHAIVPDPEPEPGPGPGPRARRPTGEAIARRTHTVGVTPRMLSPHLRRLEKLNLEPGWVGPLSLALLGLGRDGDHDEAVLHQDEAGAILLFRRGPQILYQKRLRRGLPPALRHGLHAWHHPAVDPAGGGPETPPPARAAADALVAEVSRIFAAVASQGVAEPRRLTLAGDLPRDTGLDRTLHTRLGLEVVRPEQGRGMPSCLARDRALIDLYAPILGLLKLRGHVRSPELMARKRRRPGALLRPLTSAAAAAALTLGALELACLETEASVHRRTLEILAPQPEPSPPVDPDATAREYLTGSPLPHALASLSRVVPESVLLETMKLERAGGRWVLAVEGVSEPRLGRDPVSAFGALLERIEQEPWIERVDADPWKVDRQPAKGRPAGTLRFKFRCHVSAFARRPDAAPETPAGDEDDLEPLEGAR